MNLQVTGKDIKNIGYKVFDNEGYITTLLAKRNKVLCQREEY